MIAPWKLLLLAGGALVAGSATAVDLHRLWDDRCVDCHGHAGEFARAFLVVIDGELYGRHPERDLQRFLDNHYLAGHEARAVYDMLLAQARTEGRFRSRCSACHATAAAFAREALTFENGVLVGRATGRPVADFLPRHMSLDAQEAAFFAELLERVRREVEGR